MFIYFSIMVGAYVFTRMFTAGIKAYPNDDKFIGVVIRLLSLATAFVALGCVLLILFTSAGESLSGYLPK